MRAVALFCGAGGATEGMVRAGLDVRCAVDGWDVACMAHRRWHPSMPVLCDRVENVTALGLRAGFVWASPSCKPWSTANRTEKRGTAHPEYYALPRLVADAFGPGGFGARWLVIENVGGLLWSKEGRVEVASFRAACEQARLAYTINVVNSNSLGVAQLRRRVFLVVGPSHVVIPHGSEFVPPVGVEEPLLQRVPPDLRAGASVLRDDHPNKWSDAYRFRRAGAVVDASTPSRHANWTQRTETERVQPAAMAAERKGKRMLGSAGGSRAIGAVTHSPNGSEKRRALAAVTNATEGSYQRDPRTHQPKFTGRTLAECARLQQVPFEILRGFTKHDAHALVGNAVPPPVALHVCRTILAADAESISA
jgi:site-specific DNA-cytosine methylase